MMQSMSAAGFSGMEMNKFANKGKRVAGLRVSGTS